MSALAESSSSGLKGILNILLTQFPLSLSASNLLSGHMFAVYSMSCRRSCVVLIIAFSLHQTGYSQRMTQPLVFDNSTLIDCAQPIVSGVGDLLTSSADLDLAIGKLIDVE